MSQGTCSKQIIIPCVLKN